MGKRRRAHSGRIDNGRPHGRGLHRVAPAWMQQRVGEVPQPPPPEEHYQVLPPPPPPPHRPNHENARYSRTNQNHYSDQERQSQQEHYSSNIYHQQPRRYFPSQPAAGDLPPYAKAPPPNSQVQEGQSQAATVQERVKTTPTAAANSVRQQQAEGGHPWTTTEEDSSPRDRELQHKNHDAESIFADAEEDDDMSLSESGDSDDDVELVIPPTDSKKGEGLKQTADTINAEQEGGILPEDNSEQENDEAGEEQSDDEDEILVIDPPPAKRTDQTKAVSTTTMQDEVENEAEGDKGESRYYLANQSEKDDDEEDEVLVIDPPPNPEPGEEEGEEEEEEEDNSKNTETGLEENAQEGIGVGGGPVPAIRRERDSIDTGFTSKDGMVVPLPYVGKGQESDNVSAPTKLQKVKQKHALLAKKLALQEKLSGRTTPLFGTEGTQSGNSAIGKLQPQQAIAPMADFARRDETVQLLPSKAELLRRKKVADLKRRLAEARIKLSSEKAEAKSVKYAIATNLAIITQSKEELKEIQLSELDVARRLEVVQQLKGDKLKQLIETRNSLRALRNEVSVDADGGSEE